MVGAVDNPTSLGGVVAEVEPDLLILDVRMPPTFTNEGMVAAMELRAARPGLPMLVLSQYVEPLYAAELLSSGVGSIGYLLKGAGLRRRGIRGGLPSDRRGRHGARL